MAFNAVYPEAITVTRFFLAIGEHYENRDVSVGGSENAACSVPHYAAHALNRPIHVMCVHLGGLREATARRS